MTDKIKVAMYTRKNRDVRAVIYVRGGREAAQEMFCRAHCIDKDYDLICVTRNIEDVNNCDILVVANHSRISRDIEEYVEIANRLKRKGIRIESVIDEGNAEKYIDLIITLSDEVDKTVKARMTEFK